MISKIAHVLSVLVALVPVLATSLIRLNFWEIAMARA
jgi:hypothetical protein